MSATTCERNVPCGSCPWRVDQHAGAIPGFSLAKAEGLAVNTCGPDDTFRQIMACHGSPEDAETPCIGYLCSDDGYANLNVRIGMAEAGRGNRPGWPEWGAMLDACEDIDLHPHYTDVLVKLRADQRDAS